MSHETRGAARITYADGEVQFATLSPDIPFSSREAKILSDVTRLSLLGDVVSIEPTTIEVPRDSSL